MLRLLYIYFRIIVVPNATHLITLELLLAVGVAALYLNGALTADLVGRDLPLGDLVQHTLTISGIGLGACLTAVTMAVRLGEADFAEYLATDLPSLSVNFDAVLFNLSWTALIALLTTVLGTVSLLFGPVNIGLFDPALTLGWQIVAATLIGLFLYGVMMLFATILSIAILGVQRFRWRSERDGVDRD